jgi:hypothetical protein
MPSRRAVLTRPTVTQYPGFLWPRHQIYEQQKHRTVDGTYTHLDRFTIFLPVPGPYCWLGHPKVIEVRVCV